MHDVDKILSTSANQFNNFTYTFTRTHNISLLMPRNCVFESFGLLEFNHKIFSRLNGMKFNV